MTLRRWQLDVFEMAANSTRSEFVIYEEKYWGLDPLFGSHCKFYITDVLSLHEAPGQPGKSSE